MNLFGSTRRRRFLNISIVFSIALALLALPIAPFVAKGESWPATQSDSQDSRRGNPTPGKPEGDYPDLDSIRRKQPEPLELPMPIPSTIRSPKVPENPWDGRRFGDPITDQEKPNEIVQPAVARLSHLPRAKNERTRRAHVKRSALSSPPVILDDVFIDSFYATVLPSPYLVIAAEKPYWKDQLRVGYSKGQTSVLLATIEMGKTLFESAAYGARGRSNHDYVFDLYWAYLQRAPDQSGWDFWTGQVNLYGRETGRRAFEESTEFAAKVASIVPNGSASSNPISYITSRVDPRNQPGNGLLSRDATWNVPLLSLPGRAGLDLGLSLSYSSQVWTTSGPYIYFDEDNGFPSPGFQLGFPKVQRKSFDAQTGTNNFLFVTPAGNAVELRQVGTSNIYEAGDSSYLQLTDNGTSWLVRSTDGTQLTFGEASGEYRCTQVKDRNGNYMTVNYDGWGHITTITDTLARLITFNYDSNHNLLSITQSWNGQPSHQWATFGWTTKNMQSSFSTSSLRVVGPTNGVALPVLNQVAINDGTYFQFDYTNSLQVNGIRRYHSSDTPQLLRSQLAFTLETPSTDVPRMTASSVSALNWTGINGVPTQVSTSYTVSAGACVMTVPDGTVYKEYYGTGYQTGLVTTSEIWSGGVKQKWTVNTWTQDNTSVTYQTNPRLTESNVYDSSNNRRRTTIEFWPQFGLPHIITEYKDATNVLRYTYYDYKNESDYVNRRIIGLVFRKSILDGGWNLKAKTEFNYDWSGADMFLDTPAPATQHDRTNYGPSFVIGRGNLSEMARFDVNDPNNANNTIIETKWRFNSTGSQLMERDHLWHQKFIAYDDRFSDSVNRNTFAYPTTLTDEDGNSSLITYNFDFAEVTRNQGPPPAGQTQGAIQVRAYNSVGQLDRITTTNNGSYQRFWYGPDYVASYSTTTTVADEAYSIQTFDGLGRVTGTATNNPASTGGYKAQTSTYDLMGRTFKTSNPAEINGVIVKCCV